MSAEREYDELVRRIEGMTPAQKRAHIAELHRALSDQYAGRDEHALQRRADRMARRRAQKLAEKVGRLP